jgi:hypothetical protein
MVDDGTIFQINTKYEALAPIINEKIRRYWAASEAMSLAGAGYLLFPRLLDCHEQRSRLE